MIIIIIAALIVLVYAIYLIKEQGIGFAALIFIAFEGIVCMVAFLLVIIGMNLPDTAYQYHNVKEYDLAEQGVIHLDGKKHTKYEFFYHSEDGIRAKEIDVEYCSLIYDEEQTKVVEQEGSFDQWWAYIFSYPVKKHYMIYAPEGTVKIE